MACRDIEKTREEIYDILDNPKYFFPYLTKGHFNNNNLKIFAACDKVPLLKAVEIYHDSVKRHYHERKGTTPIDLSPYM